MSSNLNPDSTTPSSVLPMHSQPLHQSLCQHTVPGPHTAAITVMVCRIWKVFDDFGAKVGDGYVFSDIKGYVMQSFMPCASTDAYCCALEEGKVYLIENFVLVPNTSQCRFFKGATTLLQLGSNTVINQVAFPLEGFLRYPIELANFEDIKHNNSEYLIDVVGLVYDVGVSRPTVKDGAQASIKVNQYDEELYFEQGWQSFCKKYGLAYAHLILFQYAGNASFDVLLFDRSMTEITYKIHTSVKQEPADDYSTMEATSNVAVKYRSRFFIILKPEEFLHKMRLPVTFTNINKGELQRGCILNVQDGYNVHVEVEKKGDKMFFTKGWKKLCDRYGLMVGHLIIFQYMGNAVFDLVIFDISTTEIKYNTATPIEFHGQGNQLRTRCNNPLMSARPYFIINITESCLQRNGQVWIPKPNREEYLETFEGNQVTLMNGHQVTAVKLIRTTTGMRFGNGWHTFATECSFKSQQQCVFELIDKLEMAYRVHPYYT